MEYLKLYFEKLSEYLLKFGINLQGIVNWFSSLNIYDILSAIFAGGGLFIMIVYFILGKATARAIKWCLILFGIGLIFFCGSIFFPQYIPSFLN